ncbi:hypothetical protein BUALT_Bualt15G0122300 [Buddleja alternifolia]|uniref:Uncharacterized protein n=1 Tax=Buddleja alternifolia TaxID=168488 RepID=A0AAV6WGI5_9LAMI|nr:hypothetical protein BUALT_Bualt15G0122300 [Buddleja alternifolia]
MYLEDQSEPIPSLVIRYDKDSLKVKSTILPVYEPAIDGHLTNTRSLAKSTHISVWSEEAAKGCMDLRSGASSNSKVILLRSSLHDTKLVDTEFLLPHQHLHSRNTSSPPLVTKEYADWWAKCWKASLAKSTKLANLEAKVPATSKDSAGSVNEVNPFNLPETNSPPHSSGKGVQVTLENENHERPQISLPPRVTEELHADENTGKKPKRSFEAPSWPLAHPEASQFSPNTIRSEAEKMLLSFYWSRICQKISKTLFEQLPEIKSDIDILIGDMKKFVQDTSTLERLLKSFFEDASSYAQVKSAYAQRETQKSHEEALKSAQQSLTEAEAQENEQAKDIKSQNDNLQRIHQQQEELRKQLAELEQNEESVNISLRKAKENLSKTREDVATQKETVLKLEKTPYLSDREVEALERMKSLLEESRENLKAFDLSS